MCLYMDLQDAEKYEHETEWGWDAFSEYKMANFFEHLCIYLHCINNGWSQWYWQWNWVCNSKELAAVSNDINLHWRIFIWNGTSRLCASVHTFAAASIPVFLKYEADNMFDYSINIWWIISQLILQIILRRRNDDAKHCLLFLFLLVWSYLDWSGENMTVRKLCWC